MPLVVIIALAGLVVSIVLSFVVASGWVSLCYRAYCAEHPEEAYLYDAQRDFEQALILTLVSGLAMTGLGIAIACKMGMDIKMMIGQ